MDLKKNNHSITKLKIFATFLVFARHSLIYSQRAFAIDPGEEWQILFHFPAWGGVWIFFTISGYLAGRGFLYTKKYELSADGAIAFYKNRLLSMLLPTYVFLLMGMVFCYPAKLFDGKLLLKFITFSFQGPGAGDGLGATWYVFMVAWLLFLAPVLCRAAKAIARHGQRAILGTFILTAAAGGALRCTLGVIDADWYTYIYSFPASNLDLFFTGILVNTIDVDGLLPAAFRDKRKIFQNMAWGALILTAVASNVLSFYGDQQVRWAGRIYKYVFPSAYLVLTCCLIAFSQNDSTRTEDRTDMAAESIGKYEFNFYLWHSLALLKLSGIIHIPQKIVSHILLILMAAVITGAISYVMTLGENEIIGRIKTRAQRRRL